MDLALAQDLDQALAQARALALTLAYVSGLWLLDLASGSGSGF